MERGGIGPVGPLGRDEVGEQGTYRRALVGNDPNVTLGGGQA